MNIAIYGYGNLGKGVELAIRQNPDTSLFGIFSRRSPESVKTLTGVKVYPASDIEKYKDVIDVLIICGGSATDLPEMTPALAKSFNVVDSFDTHAKIPSHFDNVNASALGSGHTAVISSGWDPGLFSIARLYSSAVLPEGENYTFWGRGVSQGHSDAIRRIDGVIDARQYTIPVPEAVEKVRNGENPALSAREKHTRECFVVAKEGADLDRIRNEIVTMPNYFADYDTTVHFISTDEMKKNHSALPHGGSVIRSGVTGLDRNDRQTVEFSLTLSSNPEFTASVLVACARAVFRMNKNGDFGCKTVFDIPPAYLSPLSAEELRKTML